MNSHYSRNYSITEMSEQKIRLCTLENNSYDDIKTLTKETLKQIQIDVETVNEYKNHFLVFIYFQLNLREFNTLLKSLTDVPITKIDINKISSTNNHINTNRIIFNLLSSFRFYIDHTESYIKRKYGKTSKESQDFTTLLSSYFDKYFSYRFLYKLRNFSQHLGFPIDMVPFNAKENKANPEKMFGDFKLIVSRKNLLREKKLIGSIIKNDLVKMTDDINITPLVNELAKIVFNIEKRVYSFCSELLEESISNLKLFAGDNKTERNVISIIYELKETNDHYFVKTMTIPFDEIEEIERFKNN